jgi:hypothetical protein
MVSKNVKVKIQVELKLFVSDVKSENCITSVGRGNTVENERNIRVSEISTF